MSKTSVHLLPAPPSRFRWLKRTLLILAVALVGFVAVVGALMHDARSGLKPIIDGAQLAGGAITIKDGYTAAFLLPAGEGAFALVDCGLDANGAAIKTALARKGAGLDAVKAIFLTHAHPDHIAACHLFPKADIYAFSGAMPVVAGEATTHGPLPRFIKTPAVSWIKVSRTLTDGVAVKVGTLVVRPYLVPGHTDADAVYLVDGTLYAGDTLAIREDGTLRPPVWLFSDSTDEARASLCDLAARLKAGNVQIRKIAPSHSAATDNPRLLFDFVSVAD